MTSYRGVETPQRRQELLEHSRGLQTWLRIRRDVAVAKVHTLQQYTQEHPQEKEAPPVHIIIPYKKRPDDPPTTLSYWTVSVDDILEVAKQRIGLHAANLRITREPRPHGVDMPVEDTHGKNLATAIEQRVVHETPGAFFPVTMQVVTTPEYIKKEVTELNADPADTLYWATLWSKYMEKLIVKKAHQQRRNTAVSVWIEAPSSLIDYAARWEGRIRLSFDWQTVHTLNSVIQKLGSQLQREDPEGFEAVTNRIERYYELMGDEEGDNQPQGLFPQWLYFLPDILNLQFFKQ